MKSIFLASFLLLLLAATGWAQPQPQTPAVITSPEVHTDNSVTFRFRDPNAHEVIDTGGREACAYAEGRPRGLELDRRARSSGFLWLLVCG